ncbi:MAG TPA: FHA domain-containing protein, partial [Nannocystis sp.]
MVCATSVCALASPPGAPLDRAGKSGYQGDWALASSPMIRLYITPDDQQPYLLSFERAHINVGSAEANDVRLQAPGISSRHFRLRSVGSEVVLEDGGSRNGTYVNGVKVTGSQVLSPADVIRIVGFRIKILQPEAGVAATPAAPAAKPVAAAPVPRPAAPAAVPRPAAPAAAPAAVPSPPARVEPVPAAVPVAAPVAAVVAAPAIDPAQEIDPPPGFDAARVAAIVGPRARAFSERADPSNLLRGEELQDAAIWVSCGKRVTPAAGVKERMLVARSQQVGQRHGRRRLGIAAAFGLALVGGGWTASSVLAGGPDAHAAGFSRAVVKQFLAAHDAQLRRSCEDSSRQLAEAALAEAKGSP